MSDPRLWAAFCSTCAAFADASAALLRTEAAMCGTGFSSDKSPRPVSRCSPTFGSAIPPMSSSTFRMSNEGNEQMTSWLSTVFERHDTKSLNEVDLRSESMREDAIESSLHFAEQRGSGAAFSWERNPKTVYDVVP